jgi:16S rRNA (guanine966-N2)-methyltransferase
MARGSKFRITGGVHKGRVLKAPPNLRTRPMQGFLREALFSIIGPDLSEASVLDLFSGTGSIGLEALSRGASNCVFFEHYGPVYQVLISNIKSLGLESRTQVVKIDLMRVKEFPDSPSAPFDYIFLDPPFSFHDPITRQNLDPLIQSISNKGFLSEDVLLTLQIRDNQNPPATLGSLSLFDQRNHRSSTLSFYR